MGGTHSSSPSLRRACAGSSGIGACVRPSGRMRLGSLAWSVARLASCTRHWERVRSGCAAWRNRCCTRGAGLPPIRPGGLGPGRPLSSRPAPNDRVHRGRAGTRPAGSRWTWPCGLRDAGVGHALPGRKRSFPTIMTWKETEIRPFVQPRYPAAFLASMAIAPVSSSDFRLERILGQPPETASMSFEPGRSIACVMVNFTAPPTGSSSIVQHE
jgi:hypothetical protein